MKRTEKLDSVVKRKQWLWYEPNRYERIKEIQRSLECSHEMWFSQKKKRGSKATRELKTLNEWKIMDLPLVFKLIIGFPFFFSSNVQQNHNENNNRHQLIGIWIYPGYNIHKQTNRTLPHTPYIRRILPHTTFTQNRKFYSQ